jgi:hypothetical protein
MAVWCELTAHTPEAATIFQTHVRRILQLCTAMGLRPMMYSDMLLQLSERTPPAQHERLIQGDKTRHQETGDDDQSLDQELADDFVEVSF